MKRFFLSLFVWLILAAPSFTQIKITKSERVANFAPGYCAWCSLEMCGRHLGIQKLNNLVAEQSQQPEQNVGTDWSVYYKLTNLGVEFRQQWIGNFDRNLIVYAMKHKIPICFAVRKGTFGKGTSAHAMVLTYYDDEKIEYVDPNKIFDKNGKLVYYTVGRKWFDTYWSGWLVLVEK